MHVQRALADLDAHLSLEGQATTRARLRADGFDDDQIAAAVRAGSVERVRRGAFVGTTGLRGARPEVRARRVAVAIAKGLPPGGALSHVSAALVWNLPAVGVDLSATHIVRAGQRPRGRAPGIVEHVAPDPAVIRTLTQPASVRGIRLVDPAQAIVGVSCGAGIGPGLVMADAALRDGTLTRRDLEQACERSGLTRLSRARAVLTHADPLCESPGESLLRLELLRLGLTPRSQVPIEVGGLRARVDFLLDGVVVEFDGAVKYDGAHGREALVAEKRREDALRRAGYAVVRVTWPDLFRPGAVRAALASHAPVAPEQARRAPVATRLSSSGATGGGVTIGWGRPTSPDTLDG